MVFLYGRGELPVSGFCHRPTCRDLMSVPAARNDSRLRRYPLRRLRLPMAHGTLDVVVPDAGAWLHTGGWSQRAARGEEPPYWADVWPAAVALARLL